MIVKLVKILITIDVIVAIVCLKNKIWLYNTQIGFFSTLLIIIGSFIGYSNLVKSKKEIKKVKWNEALILSFKGFNLIRIIGYASLIFGFFWLNNKNIFDVVSFLVGVSIIPFVMLIIKIR